MEIDGLRYPWFLPARIYGRYLIGEEEGTMENGLMVPDPSPTGFQRPYTGVLDTRNWNKWGVP